MSTYDTTANQGNDGVRPDYIILGTDTTGAQHVYDTTTETVHIVHPDGSRGRKILWDTSKTVDDYVEAVADGRGWDTRRYGRSLIKAVTEPLIDE